MKIRVMYDRHHQDTVNPEELAILIAERRIIKFKRFSGWVDVRTDPVRRQKGSAPGTDRRKQAEDKKGDDPGPIL
ncbi:hypothetical protein JCM30471_27050 [Desulfuromonas carbonis]|uniref:GSU3473 family protein n=1 Tax=Desulfuromonas sp. DDH964 TaxID=1823759 RepID=UPI00078E8B2A|nr:hypothetical protein [Desulfuromonas sp. DDH964]AMV70898.1 hypothetical protein DBW_0497 [Desulfuromonas sp. DDH964]